MPTIESLDLSGVYTDPADLMELEFYIAKVKTSEEEVLAFVGTIVGTDERAVYYIQTDGNVAVQTLSQFTANFENFRLITDEVNISI